jgi:hypothetical protein
LLVNSYFFFYWELTSPLKEINKKKGVRIPFLTPISVMLWGSNTYLA